MDKKICKICGKELPLTDFYNNNRLSDGHTNECKDCIKERVRARYLQKIQDPVFVEKERARGREKYYRLGYGTKRSAHNENKNTRRDLSRIINIPSHMEVHHWNYHLRRDIFLMDKRTHKLIHNHLIFDKTSECFFYNGKLLNTKEEHSAAIYEIANKACFKVDIISLNLSIND